MNHRHLALALLALAVPSLAAAQDGERSYTISPNERIHVIQRKVDLLEGRLEVTLYPVSVQINSRWTEHLGLVTAAAYHVAETFAVQAFLGYNLMLARETDLQSELREKALLQPPSAPSVITKGYAFFAGEVSPFYGKLGFYEDAMLSFALFVTAGVGVVGTGVQLLQRTPVEDGGRGKQVVAGAGLWGAGLVGAGFRVNVSENVAVRLEVRDLIYSVRVTHLNGCNRTDLSELSGAAPQPSASCKWQRFDPENLNTDAKLAEGRTDGSSETVNQVGAYLGFSYYF